MKSTLLILSLLICVNIYSNETDTLKLSSSIKDVVVFFDGAQISREAKINLVKGKHLLVLEELPAELNPQSIQIESDNSVKIISVKHELTYPEDNGKVEEQYEKVIERLKIRVKEITNEINVYDIEEKILLDNSRLTAKDKNSSLLTIKEAASFYRAKLNEIRENKLDLSIESDSIKKKINDMYFELNMKISQKNKIYSKISFNIESLFSENADFKISYFVTSAGWSPLYDFRVVDINKPLNLVYNANIFQTTGEDWENVNLTLSTNRPSLTNKKPELNTWFINRRNNNSNKTTYNGQSTLKGQVTDAETGESVPFANIAVRKDGVLVSGCTSDIDGMYLIKPIKPGYYDVSVSFVGYDEFVKSVYVSSDKITFEDFEIIQSRVSLEEVVVMDYKVPLVSKDKTTTGATLTANEISTMSSRSASAVATTVGGVYSVSDNRSASYQVDGYETETNITSFEYKIDIPYTIPSDGNDYSVKIKEVKYPVNYVYYCVPKLDKDVFLIAEITGWTKLNLLSGKSSIYYQGTFTGESTIDANSTKDTLDISLSRDKNIIVKRTLLKEKNEKQFIGKNIKETINWNIEVRNNRSERVQVLIEDQFPLSENKSVEIDRLNDSNGKVNDKTGKVQWRLDLEPNEKKELILSYSVKFPNYMNIYID